MATLGYFCQADADASRKVFVVENTNLAVDDSSVSSDYITDSDDAATNVQGGFSGAEGKRRKKKKRLWRVKHSLSKHRHLRDDSDSSSSSRSGRSSRSSSTSSSSDSSSSEKPSEKQPKPPSRNERRMSSMVHFIDKAALETRKIHDCSQGHGNHNFSLQWNVGSKKYRDLAHAAGFLSQDEILALHRAAHHPSVKEIHDRKAYLAFKHRVVRFEMQLRALEPVLYNKLMSLMRMADAEGWKRLRKKKARVYPEIEYIEYDVKNEGGECFIEPHVDNKSGVTLVAMLSPPSDYEGGISCFRRASGAEGHRQMKLGLGDAVMFRGEKLLHWITNVTAGRRVILQIELSRV
eukprot:TRINITY_DN12589_c0_g2_i8.p1 TRINITY_DN12589_c0_g2~~TRINITY_DN12589_c0_g2_i8.p1  ORF type:complete len:349 (-),score=67.40 TRINITY_DN12589_c0_g2_i8:350-1396(-)